MDRIKWFDKYRPRIVFCKPKTLNAHNFLITWRIRKIQSSPESLFRAHKKYKLKKGSGGKLRVGRVSLNKQFFFFLALGPQNFSTDTKSGPQNLSNPKFLRF